MSIVIPYIFINFISFPLVQLFNRKFGEVVPFSLILSTLFLYVGGILQNIKLGLFLLIISTICLYIYLFINKYISKESIKLYISTGFIVFTLLYIFVSIYHRYTCINKWDEFTLWGPAVKEILRLNKFYSVDESLLKVGKQYYPFAMLLESIWCFLCRRYEDRFLFRALSTFCISMFMPAIDKSSTQKNLINNIFLYCYHFHLL